MRIVSNTSPLIFLSKLGAFDLLALCFDNISIPQAVQEELGEFTLIRPSHPGHLKKRVH